MNQSLKVSLVFLVIFIIFIPQYRQKNTSPKPEVKSANIHQLNLPKTLTPVNIELSANSIYILDLTSNTVLYQKNSLAQLFPASLTKIMTAVVALEHFVPDQILNVKSADRSIGNTMNLEPGDKLTTTDLIYGLLVSSGNDAALALAENYPGGYSQFIIAMNNKAQELGLNQTHFNNVSGVEDQNHLTTAQDLTKLTQYALKNIYFRQAVSTKSIEITSINGVKYSLNSTNKLLEEVPGVLGVKTGWTPEAGECLITLIDTNGHLILITILGSKDRFGETKQIINWINNNLSQSTLTTHP